jgi:zinc D-Ala-D-Ala carboxypeptidase
VPVRGKLRNPRTLSRLSEEECYTCRGDICRRTRRSNFGATMQISEHFTLEELSFSEAAARRGVDNTPPPVVIANLSVVVAVMERIRTLLGDRPIVVRSGYRSAEVNRAVGGVETSAHCHGLACDFVCPAFGTPAEAALVILKSDIDYDQLILEYGWIHIGLAQKGFLSRREALTKRSQRAEYEFGIKA